MRDENEKYMYYDGKLFTDDPNKRYPLGSRDNEYIINMEKINDRFWKDEEKWYYFKREHQNMILPTILACFVVFITNPPFMGFLGIIAIIGLVLYLCYIDNKRLDNDPWIQYQRKRSREFRRRNYHMDV